MVMEPSVDPASTTMISVTPEWVRLVRHAWRDAAEFRVQTTAVTSMLSP
jgi:hypothetical protein